MDNVDQFVDAVYAELEKLYNKDKDLRKRILGNDPMKVIFDNYSEWLSKNLSTSPKVAANAIYKDVIGVGYLDFFNKKLKKNVQLKGQTPFNLIYGTPQEIDKAFKILNELSNTNNVKFQLVTAALEKVKEISSQVMISKNIFGKPTAAMKQTTQAFKLPRYATFETFMKMTDQQLKSYIKQLDKSIQKPVPTTP